MDEKAALGYPIGWRERLKGGAAADAPAGPLDPEAYERIEHGPCVRVGPDEGDLRGADHRAIQAAVEYVAKLGGGTVELAPGRYTLRNAVALRDRVRLRGTPGKTMLVACDGAESPLALDGDCNERRVTLARPEAFRVGDGISVQTPKSGGFATSTATLVARAADDPRAFLLDRGLYLDYLVKQEATARLAFPLVGAWQVRDAIVEGLVLDGNKEKAQPLNGCRGGAYYAFESERLWVRQCEFLRYAGDGISFQVSQDVWIEDCLAAECTHLGLHPGSGSQRPVVRRNTSRANGSDGIFVCWRVKHGLFEANTVEANGGQGVSIGHKDTDNLFAGNTIVNNAKAGVLFRDESEPMGAHRNVFEGNTILDNGQREALAAVEVRGETHDLVFRGNTIGRGAAGNGPDAGIWIGPQALRVSSEGNVFKGVKQDLVKG
ncbi:MAG: hypothetical protein AMXMBFR7_07700 [Planctomycetota bacterium]